MVADIAAVVAAGVQRHDIALCENLIRGGTVEALPGGDQTVFEEQASDGLRAPKGFNDFAFGLAWPHGRKDCEHGVDDAFGCLPQQLQFHLSLHGT